MKSLYKGVNSKNQSCNLVDKHCTPTLTTSAKWYNIKIKDFFIRPYSSTHPWLYPLLSKLINIFLKSLYKGVNSKIQSCNLVDKHGTPTSTTSAKWYNIKIKEFLIHPYSSTHPWLYPLLSKLINVFFFNRCIEAKYY